MRGLPGQDWDFWVIRLALFGIRDNGRVEKMDRDGGYGKSSASN